MTTRSYGQYCGIARALELVGERWSLLIVRDLLVGPKRFTDLHRGLPGIPTNVLTARLKELEDAGIAARRALPPPERAVVYELTPDGCALEDVVLALGRWGSQRLGEPRANEARTADSMIMALRTTFRPQAARGARVTYELRMGDIVLAARVEKGTVSVVAGPAQEPDLVIDAPRGLRALFAGEISATEALKSGHVHVRGDRRLLTRFAQTFRIGA